MKVIQVDVNLMNAIVIVYELKIGKYRANST